MEGVYLRVSTHKQDLVSQIYAIDQWLKKNRKKTINDVRIYKDEGISGIRDDRPGLLSLLEDAKKGMIDMVIVYRLDRLGRRANSAIALLLQLDEAGASFISVSQPVLNLGKDNPFRRTMLAAFSEIAELERDAIVTRIKAGIKVAKKKGKKLGAPSKWTQFQLDQARILRNEGKTIRAIAKELSLGVGIIHRLLTKKD